jgi:large subunit ribosomal protein L4
MKIGIKNLSNEDVRERELPEGVFDYPYKEHLIHIAVVAYQAGQRSGSHSTKTKGDVRGSGKKLWRQKGTGRARVGSLRSPLWRTGGVIHGPQPRSHAKSLNVREKKNALRSALSQKVRDGEMVVLESLELDLPKTGPFDEQVQGLGLDGKVLFVDSRENDNLQLAVRNNPRMKTVDALAVNIYDVVDRTHVVFSESALTRLIEVLS